MEDFDKKCHRCGFELDKDSAPYWDEDGIGTCENCRLTWEEQQLSRYE